MLILEKMRVGPGDLASVVDAFDAHIGFCAAQRKFHMAQAVARRRDDGAASVDIAAADEIDALAGAAVDPDGIIFFDAPVVDGRTAGGLILAAEHGFHDRIVVETLGLDRDPAATGVVEEAFVVVVVAGEGEKLTAAAQDLIPVGGVVAGV